jgi:hypothetical protein
MVSTLVFSSVLNNKLVIKLTVPSPLPHQICCAPVIGVAGSALDPFHINEILEIMSKLETPKQDHHE